MGLMLCAGFQGYSSTACKEEQTVQCVLALHQGLYH